MSRGAAHKASGEAAAGRAGKGGGGGGSAESTAAMIGSPVAISQPTLSLSTPPPPPHYLGRHPGNKRRLSACINTGHQALSNHILPASREGKGG